MGPFLAAGWTLLATFAFLFIVALLLTLRPTERAGLVTGVAAQVVAYSLTVFFLLRVHAPDVSVGRLVGLRPTAWSLYVLGAALGLAVQLPINALYAALIERFPPAHPSDLEAVYHAASTGQRVMMGLGLVAFGPAAEELFFRGALYGPLARPAARTASAVAVSGILFAAVHFEWQQILVILPLGLLLGALRATSGSIVPSTLAHAAFNSVALAQLVLRMEDVAAPAPILIATSAATAVIMGLIVWVGRRSAAAQQARELEAA